MNDVARNIRVGVDIGGTFTDIVLRGPGGELTVDKVLTTHEDLLEGFFRGVGVVLAHPYTIAKDRATGCAAGWIDGEDCDRLRAAAQLASE